MNNTSDILHVKSLSKSFANVRQAKVHALRDISITVKRGSFFTLLGPSGCGKSTLLRCISGIETPDAGEITIDNTSVFSSTNRIDVAASQRALGMVFQSFAIWPHMSVYENVAFGLKAVKRKKSWTSSDIKAKAIAALEMVSMEQMQTRRGADLSGGQKQRLALARAIATEPKLILLDEPLSNLDAKLREKLRFELKDLQLKLGLSFVYVTHDQQEALSLSNQIAVMNNGSIQQVGTPREIYQTPANSFVAEFVGKSNYLNTDRTEFVRPEQIQLSVDVKGGKTGWKPCTYINQHYYGDHIDVVVEFEGQHLTIKKSALFTAPINNQMWLKIT